MSRVREPYRSALMRALHTFWETLAASSPAGLIITVPMIREADWGYIGLTILGWLATAALAGVFSFVKSMAVGMPETTPDCSMTWEQFKGDQGRITVKAVEDDDSN